MLTKSNVVYVKSSHMQKKSNNAKERRIFFDKSAIISAPSYIIAAIISELKLLAIL